MNTHPPHPFDWFAERLDVARWESQTPGSRGGFFACPVCGSDDNLHITEKPDGAVLIKCFSAGCEVAERRVGKAALINALDANETIASPVITRSRRIASPPVPPEVAADPLGWLAAKCSCEPSFLDTLPLSFDQGRIVYQFEGLDVVKTRVAGSKTIDWRPAGATMPVVWPLFDVMPESAIFTEGETDAIALMALGYDAFAFTKGAGGAPSVAELKELRARGLNQLFIGFDADEAGRKGESVVITRALEAGLDVASIVPPDYDPLSGRGKDWCEWRAAGGEVLPESGTNDPMLDHDGLVAAVKDRPEPVIPGWLMRGGVLLLVADPKTGKTSLAFGMASAAERKVDFAGIPTQQMGSLWLSEEGFDTFEEKVRRYDLQDYRVLFRHTAAQHGLTFEAAVARAATRAAREGRILVIDTIGAWGGLESEADATQVNAALSVIRFAVGPRRVPTIVIHQTNRSGGYRGSTEFLAQVDAMAVVSKTGAEEYGDEARAVTITSRYEGAADPVVLVRDGAEYTAVGAPRISHGRSNDRRAENVRRLRALLTEEPRTKSQLVTELGVAERTLDEYLKDIGAVGERIGTGSADNEKVWSLSSVTQSVSQPVSQVRIRSAHPRSPVTHTSTSRRVAKPATNADSGTTPTIRGQRAEKEER